ncbi:MAG TPA: hypothetical protein VIR81_16530 [Myxococcales bacterium]
MDRRPGVLWFLVFCVALGLFWLPVINGIVAGAFGGWFEREPHKAAGHALATALALFPVLWIMGLYGVVWSPFSSFSASARAAFCCLPLFAIAAFTCAMRTTHRSPAL